MGKLEKGVSVRPRGSVNLVDTWKGKKMPGDSSCPMGSLMDYLALLFYAKSEKILRNCFRLIRTPDRWRMDLASSKCLHGRKMRT